MPYVLKRCVRRVWRIRQHPTAHSPVSPSPETQLGLIVVTAPLMSNEWPSPYARNHVRCSVNSCSPPPRYYFPQVSPTVVDQGPSIFPYVPMDRYSMNAVTKPCACTICTGSTSNGPPTWCTTATYHQNWDARPPLAGVSTVSLEDARLSSDHGL